MNFDNFISSIPSATSLYPLMGVVWALLFDLITRLAPALRNHMRPLLGFPSYFTQKIENKLNRAQRSKGALFVRGFMACFLLIALCFGSSYLLNLITKKHTHGGLFVILILFSGLNTLRLWSLTFPLIKILKQDGHQATTKAMKLLHRHHIAPPKVMQSLDKYSIVRLYAQEISQSLDRGLVAPVFWYVVPELFNYDGLTMFILSISLGEAVRFLAIQGVTSSPFSKTFITLDALLHFIPARITTILLWITAIFTPSANPFQAIKTVFLQGHHYYLPNTGWPFAAIAGALNIALFSGIKKHIWIGPKHASAKTTWIDLKRAFIFHIIAYIISLLILSSLILLSVNG